MKKIAFSVLGVFAAALLVSVGYLLWSDQPPTHDEFDIAILETTLGLLPDESGWSKQDDRQCEPQDDGLSLYCALRQASLEVSGHFEHRAPSLEAVRAAIDELKPENEYAHRLMDFNNSPEVSLAMVHDMLRRAIGRLEQQYLSAQSVTGFVEVPGGRVFYEMYHPEASGIPVLLIPCRTLKWRLFKALATCPWLTGQSRWPRPSQLI
ncbi:MAG: hypothetical protein ACI80V_001106 [Rhodothermales bacterium]|jgi:hypothetical protein